MAVQGKYGFYPATYEQYRRLKRLNFLSFESRRRDAAWRRWFRKDPHNRLLYRYERHGDFKVKIEVGPAPEPERSPLYGTGLYCQIEEEYRRARYPVTTAEGVKPLAFSDRTIAEMLEKLEGWYATKVERVAA